MFALLIPTGSDHDRARVPVATWVLIGANFLLFLPSILFDYEPVIRRFGFVPAQHLPYQFITHMFLHAPWPHAADADWTAYANALLHIGFNMAFLWFAGSDLEDVLGSAKFLVVYFLSGLASAVLYWITAVVGGFELNEPAVGASGAISGLLGLYLVRFPRFKIRMWYCALVLPIIIRQGVARISSIYFIGFWIGPQIFMGIQAILARGMGDSHVAVWGHIGGFLGGLVWGLATQQWKLGEEEYLLKEADHLFYKQQWYRAMDYYKRVTESYSHCVEAHVKWALCWECLGQAKRAETVLAEALSFYTQQGWKEEAEIIQDELRQIVLQSAEKQEEQQPPTLVENRSPPSSNLMFRRDLKWKAKKT